MATTQKLDPEAVAKLLFSAGALVLTADPGAGKTTRVPPALLAEASKRRGQIWIIQPRKLAARLSAVFVAEQLGQVPGETVGYWVRDARCIGPQTQLIFMTEGMLWRRLLAHPSADIALRDVAALIFDEFHQRSMASDVALAVAQKVRQTATSRRHPLALMVMSATLDAQAVAASLADAPIMAVAGRQYPVTLSHLPQSSRAALTESMLQVLPEFLKQTPLTPTQRDCLIFLPGVAEIEALRSRLARHALSNTYDIHPLHARLSAAQQDLAVRKAARPRLILSTNVAETSITLPQIGYVIDSTLARVPKADGMGGWVRLSTEPISQAAMAQRMGRAGRTGPGRCLRMLTTQQSSQRPAFDLPELLRLPVDNMLLSLACLGVTDFCQLHLVDQPPAAAIAAARTGLIRMKAIDSRGRVTKLGRTLAQLPVSARLAASLVRAKQLGVLPYMCRAAMVLQELPKRQAQATSVGLTDVWTQIGVKDLDPGLEREAQRLDEQAGAVLLEVPTLSHLEGSAETRLAQAFLAGFSDQLACRQGTLAVRTGGLPLAVAHRGPAQLSPCSVVRDNRLMLVLSARMQDRTGLWEVTSAAGIEPDWLVDFDADGIEEHEEFLPGPGHKLQRRTRMRYAGIVIFEEVVPVADPQVRSEFQRAAILQSSAAELMGARALEQMCSRLTLVLELEPELRDVFGDHQKSESKSCCEAWILQSLRQYATDLYSDDMLLRPWPEMLWRQALMAWPHRLHQALERLTPQSIRLGAKDVAVHYRYDKPPMCAAPIQLFFGRQDGPRIARDRVPLVLELLGPHGRPLQTTQDLLSFWKTHYPAMRRQLARRYPRHLWPEDPQAAAPLIHRPRAKKN